MDGRYEVFEVIRTSFPRARRWSSAFECDTPAAIGVGLVQLANDRVEVSKVIDNVHPPEFSVFDHELQLWICGPPAPGIPRAKKTRQLAEKLKS